MKILNLKLKRRTGVSRAVRYLDIHNVPLRYVYPYPTYLDMNETIYMCFLYIYLDMISKFRYVLSNPSLPGG